MGAASAQTISSKRAEAEAIMAQVQQLDADLASTIEAWNYANIELDRIDGDLEVNARHLGVAKKSLGVAQTRIAKRIRDLYVNGSGDSTLEVLLGASSLEDVLARLDTIERVSHQDASVLSEVKQFKREVEVSRVRLQEAREEQARIVEERAAQKASIESRLAEREQMLASVREEIERMQAEERARQARLAAEARARAAAEAAAAEFAAQTAAAAASSSYVDPVAGGGSTASVSSPSIPVPAARYGGVVGIALQFLGVPYVWGGMSPSGFDCSGLISYVYSQVGVSLPHHAASQYSYGVPVSRDQLQAGDLVFFNGLSHAGIYIGGGQFVHAPHSGDVVKISSLYDSWYASTWYGGRRIL